MDGVELARQIAADLHRQAQANGQDHWQPYEFALAEALRRGFDVESTATDSVLLHGGRATLIVADGLILHENTGTPFEQAFLVAHEIGHLELGDDLDEEPVREIDPARAAEASPVGIDRVVDYGRRQRREIQMDLFAREFLLPRHVVRALHLEERCSASEIAERLGAPFDLRAHGAERFVAFETDRDYKLTLDDRQLEWGKPAIGGAALYALSGVSEGQAIFLEVRGGEDQLIDPEDLVDLNEPGIERFITAPRPSKTYEIIVNSRPREVEEPHVTFEQIVQLAFPGTHDNNVVFSMTYRHTESKPHAGELAAGGSVDVKKKGTMFNVTRTVQS